MAEIPLARDPADVTPEWLTAVLRDRGHEVTVASIESASVGTGQVAHCERFEVTYDAWDGRAARSFVGKFRSPDELSRRTGSAGTYQREVNFYRHIHPTVGIRTPEAQWLDMDEDSGDFVLLMEDMAPAEQGDQMHGCTVAEATAALDEAARLHAPRWGDDSLEGYPFLVRPGDEAARVRRYERLWPGFLDRYSDQLDEATLAVGHGLAPLYSVYSRPYPGTRCVTHGDYRLDNMLIGNADGEHQVAVVDWQTVGIGAAAQDVSYFLGAGLLPEDRRTHERDLVAGYHAQLQSGGVEGYSLEQLWDDYRWYSYAGYVMAVTASMVVVRTERGDEMFMTMARRHAQQAIDLEAQSLLEAAR